MYYSSTQLIRSDSRPLIDVQSPYQRITLWDGNDGLSLFLNGEIQFVESEERSYHNTLASYPFYRNSHIQNVVLMGAGDGLAARNIFEMNPNAKVYVCELDGKVVGIFKSLPRCRTLTHDSLYKCHVCLGDASQTIQDFKDDSIDLVIADFPDRHVDTLGLYSGGLYGDVHRVLKKDGLISLYSSGTDMRNELDHLFGEFHVYHLPKRKMGGLSIVSGMVRK